MTKTTTSKQITQSAAEGLWDELRSAFVNAEQAIIKIIETKAWEPLGYDTFSQAWNDRMRGVRLAAVCTPHIVYRMLDEVAAQPVKLVAAQPVKPVAAQPVKPVAAQPVKPVAAQPVKPVAATEARRSTLRSGGGLPTAIPVPKQDPIVMIAESAGVSPELVEQLARQKANGVPAHMASTRVRSHDRVLPQKPYMLTLVLTEQERENFVELCRAKRLDLHTEALKAVRAHFARLEQRRGK